MTDFHDLSERLYPERPSASPSAAATPGVTTALTPQGVPGTATAPERVRDARDRELLGDEYPQPKELYPVEGFARQRLLQHQDALSDTLGWTRVQRQAFNRRHVEMLKETGLEALTFGESILDAQVEALTAAARGEAIDDAPDLAFGEEVRRELREQHGADYAERLIADAQRFVQASPKLAAVLSTPGIGAQRSAKTAIEALLEHVRLQRHRVP
jgi:hypothetical protein